MLLRVSLICIVIGILYLSLTPSETLTVGNDKISHFIAYSCLMLNIGMLIMPMRSKLWLGMLAAIVFGGLIEVCQHFIPGRFMSWGDVLANSIGVCIGCLLAIILYKPIHSRLKK